MNRKSLSEELENHFPRNWKSLSDELKNRFRMKKWEDAGLLLIDRRCRKGRLWGAAGMTRKIR